MRRHWISPLGLAAFVALTPASVPAVSDTGGELQAAAPPAVVVTADFGQWTDYPLSKTKFAVYNSGLVKLPHYDRDIALFEEVKPHSLRIDLWWGGGPWSPQPVSGNLDALRYHFDQMDHLAELLNARQIRPCWAYSYVPSPLQDRPGDWRRLTGKAKLWGEVVGTFARHAKEGGPLRKIGYHEIYNEPDNRDFFRGSREDYFAMYREGSRAIRAADPDAVIGGPALAFTPSWIGPFLEAVETEHLPLDFFSFHFYPRCWGTNTIRDVIRQIRGELIRHPLLATTEMHLNEFNSYPIDYPRGGAQDRYGITSAMFHDYQWFLAQPDLAQVSWAQFQDTAGGNWSGMISYEGHRKALFNAAAIYARMPTDRRQVSVRGESGIEAMASADEARCSLLIWSRSVNDQRLEVEMPRISFPRGRLRVYRIDAGHCSWGDNPANEELTATEEHPNIATQGLRWGGIIPREGVVYLECDNLQRSERARPLATAMIVRTLNFYPERESRAYADFDCREWTARLGMAEENQGLAQVGIVAEGLPEKLRVTVATGGAPQRLDSNSVLGLRFDYLGGSNYTHSILYHQKGLYDSKRNAPLPWGTMRQADQVVAVPDFSSFGVSPVGSAPASWSGRVEITFLMQNTGSGSRAKIRLQAP